MFNVRATRHARRRISGKYYGESDGILGHEKDLKCWLTRKEKKSVNIE